MKIGKSLAYASGYYFHGLWVPRSAMSNCAQNDAVSGDYSIRLNSYQKRLGPPDTLPSGPFSSKSRRKWVGGVSRRGAAQGLLAAAAAHLGLCGRLLGRFLRSSLLRRRRLLGNGLLSHSHPPSRFRAELWGWQIRRSECNNASAQNMFYLFYEDLQGQFVRIHNGSGSGKQ